MARKSEPLTIGERTFAIQQMPALVAQDGISRVAAIFGESISALWETKSGGLLTAISALGRRAKDVELAWLRARYLSCTKIVVSIKNEAGEEKQKHELAADVELLESFDLDELNVWFMAHTTLNYRDFFLGLIVSSATKLSSLSSTLDSETATAAST